VTTNNSFKSWALGKYCDFFPVLHSLLRGIGRGYISDAMTHFNIWMMRPEPSVNSWYSDKVGTLILISCLVFYVCWKVKVFFKKFFISLYKIVWLSCRGGFIPDCKYLTPPEIHQLNRIYGHTQQYYDQPQQYFESLPPPGNAQLQQSQQYRNNIQPPFMPTYHNQLQQTQQYYAQPHQSQQYYAQLRQELCEGEYIISQGGFTPGVLQHPVSHHLSSPLPSTPYLYCNNIQTHNLHVGQFSTPPRSERRLYLNELLDYSAKKVL
jgi:hypothetical protein